MTDLEIPSYQVEGGTEFAFGREICHFKADQLIYPTKIGDLIRVNGILYKISGYTTAHYPDYALDLVLRRVCSVETKNALETALDKINLKSLLAEVASEWSKTGGAFGEPHDPQQ